MGEQRPLRSILTILWSVEMCGGFHRMRQIDTPSGLVTGCYFIWQGRTIRSLLVHLPLHRVPIRIQRANQIAGLMARVRFALICPTYEYFLNSSRAMNFKASNGDLLRPVQVNAKR